MKKCPQCGKFYDEDCFAEDVCPICFSTPRKSKQCLQCQYYDKKGDYCIAGENVEYTTLCQLNSVLKSLDK